MRAKNSEAEKIAEGKQVQVALAGMESRMPADLTAAHLAALIAEIEVEIATIKQIKSDQAAAFDGKRKSLKAMRELLKRARSGAKSAFGDDSLEYERLGGKRASERKKPTKKAAPATE